MSKNFSIKLSKDFLNSIIIDLEENIDEPKYNIELMTLNYNSTNNINLILKKGIEKIYLNVPENDLKIGKISILNIDLKFKLFFREFEIKETIGTKKNKLSFAKASENKDNKYISKKRNADNNYEYIYKTEEEIPFEIDIKEIKGNNIRFCLHKLINNNIMTIHDMSEDIKDNYQFQSISLNDLDSLKTQIFSKINRIKDEFSKTSLKNINFQIIEDEYNNDIIYYNLLNLEFEEKHLLAFIDYSYKYLCHNMSNVIEQILNNFASEIKDKYEFIKSKI